jgi:hypothetical protein
MFYIIKVADLVVASESRATLGMFYIAKVEINELAGGLAMFFIVKVANWCWLV